MKKFEPNEPYPKSALSLFDKRDMTRFPKWEPQFELEGIPEEEAIQIREEDLRIEIEHVPAISMPETKIPKVRITHIPSMLSSECASFMTRSENEQAAKALLQFRVNDFNYEQEMSQCRKDAMTRK